MYNLTGSIVAIVTPFYRKSGLINYEKFEELVYWHINQNTNGIVVAGSTGESPTLTTKEWIKLLEIALQSSNKKIPIIAGTGTNNTKTTIKKTLLAEKIGVDAALIVTPYYNKPTQLGLNLHFSKIANKTTLPIILYNVPSRTGCDLLPKTVGNLSNKYENIIGLKEATGQLERVTQLKKYCKEKFILLSGDDTSFLEFMLHGGNGVISVAANICPLEISSICKLLNNYAQKNNPSIKEIARNFNNCLNKLYKILMIESNPIPVKWLLGYLKNFDTKCRSPLTSLSKKYHKEVLSVYNDTIDAIKELNLNKEELSNDNIQKIY